MGMSEKQVIVITHSPYFVELSLFSPGRNLVSVRKIGLLSHIATNTKDLSTIS
jgi:predicted ATP-dependent endonuclease of OLD family